MCDMPWLTLLLSRRARGAGLRRCRAPGSLAATWPSSTTPVRWGCLFIVSALVCFGGQYCRLPCLSAKNAVARPQLRIVFARFSTFSLAGTYFDLGPRQVKREGIYNYMCTRNNNFSNVHRSCVSVLLKPPCKNFFLFFSFFFSIALRFSTLTFVCFLFSLIPRTALAKGNDYRHPAERNCRAGTTHCVR